MESTASGGRNSQAVGQRRVWNEDEERALIQGLRDLVARGWKCDNGFRNGYTTILEQHMQQMFPGTSIRAEPHISSKITVWKKNYGLLLGMLGTSGFEWSETGNMLTVKNADIWKAYVKVRVVHPASLSVMEKESVMLRWRIKYWVYCHPFAKRRTAVFQNFPHVSVTKLMQRRNELPKSDNLFTFGKLTSPCISLMDRMTSLENIARGFRLEGWTELEEKLSDLMQKEFTWMKVQEKIHCLQGHYREFLRFLTIPGVRVHDDGGLVSVNREYWNVVGEESNMEVFFCWNGFKWYNHCVQLWNIRGAAEVNVQANPGANNENPICLDDTITYVVLSEDEMEDDLDDYDEVDQHVGSPIHDLPLPMDPLFNVDGNEDLMDEESDVDSCVDSV
ncbi:translationally-controlled tumor protein homolog [Striga asiatica]|uniref:Translationally-controlled tumor protein homolog n=1 Tax=Striga asiatica TaxID=4170 RepID=A0A5A7PNH8_STRAF|nr:translationally-controlled tumor protein homolog [Striga asiatica]